MISQQLLQMNVFSKLRHTVHKNYIFNYFSTSFIDQLNTIIKAFPQLNPMKAYDVSAYPLSFYTGARVSSVVNIELRDIVQVIKEADGSY